MSNDRTRNVATEIMQALDRRDLDGVLSRFAPDARFHGFAPTTVDAEGYRDSIGALLDAFPDSRFHIDDVVVDGEKASVRHRMTGTHRNPFQGVPAGGNEVTVNAIAILHLRDGVATECWLSADFMGLMQQIGAIPTPETN